jgi:hypothetical protein
VQAAIARPIRDRPPLRRRKRAHRPGPHLHHSPPPRRRPRLRPTHQSRPRNVGR